jgi:hypothetical protein
MKAHRNTPQFEPVVLTLENQEEIDSMYALFNSAVITKALPALFGGWNLLADFVDEGKAQHKFANLQHHVIE